MLRYILVAAGIVSSLNAFAAGPTTWTRALPDGEMQFLRLHPQGSAWRAELIDETPGQLPSLAWHRDFEREAEARQFASGFANRNLFNQNELNAPAVLTLAATTEVTSASLWKATESWSWEWEQRYAQWIRTETSPRFFTENKIATDCADVAYSLRFIFARTHGLPIAFHLGGSGVVFSHESMKSSWLELPTNSDWRKDQRFLAGLAYLLDMTYTHDLIVDSYPIAISPTSLIEGTHHLDIHPESGHTMMVYKLDLSDTSTSPLDVMYSTTPQAVRELMHNGYWRVDQPKQGLGGFLRIRWPMRARSGWELAAPESHPYYSAEQFAPEFVKDKGSFAQAVLLNLNPKLDFRARLQEGINYLKDQLTQRVTLVEQGYAVCRREACPEGSSNYEDWSTPSRDNRIGETIQQIESLVTSMQSHIPGFQAPWQEALKANALTMNGETYTLDELVFAWKNRTYSPDPARAIAERWGITPEAFATAVSKRIGILLDGRSKRIAAQGNRCQKGCEPGSDGWASWNSFDYDTDLQSQAVSLSDYCAHTSVQRCAAMKQAQARVTLPDTGKGDTLAHWADLAPWLISDPRAGTELRWGSRRDQRRSHFIEPQGRLEITESGIAADQTDLSNVLQGTETHTSRIYDLVQGIEIPPPAGMSWAKFEPKQGWAAAWNKTDGIPSVTVQARDVRTGLLLTETRVPNRAKLDLGWWYPGILFVASPEEGLSLFDLSRKPVFAADHLPFPNLRNDFHASWISGDIAGKQQFVAYENGAVLRHPLSLDTGDKPSYVGFSTPGNTLINHMNCQGTTCTYGGMFGINHRTGEISKLVTRGQEFVPTPDGKYALLGYWINGADEHVDLVDLDDHLKPISSKKLGTYLKLYERYLDWQIAQVEVVGGSPRLLRYRSGSWQELALLSDESALKSFQGEFVVTALRTGGQRLRRFDSRQALLETAKGSLAMVGARAQGEEMQTALLMHEGSQGYGALYDLRDVSQPLLTGKFDGLVTPEQTTPWVIEHRDPVNQSRGILLPCGLKRKLWIDDAQ